MTVETTTILGPAITTLSTNIDWPGSVDSAAPNAQANLDAYAPPTVRLHAGTDFFDPPSLPSGLTSCDWAPPRGFAPLDRMIDWVLHYGGHPLMTIEWAPEWMWNCDVSRTCTFTDFATFAEYAAELVAYYNRGVMTDSICGVTITNPEYPANRIDQWELWNEPDCLGGHPLVFGTPASSVLTPAEYLTMWNTVVPRMLGVDPTIRVVGPALCSQPSAVFDPAAPDQDYIPQLLRYGSPLPNAISFHAYGGGVPDQTDVDIFAGTAPNVVGLDQAKMFAAAAPMPVEVWITETNVNSASPDVTRRPWTEYGAAWFASAFREYVLHGADLVHQYEFITGNDLTLVDQNTGVALLPYWVNLYLAQYFPSGSTLLSASSDVTDVETLAVRDATSGNVRVLVANRQVAAPTDVGGTGVPTSVLVQLNGMSPSAASLMVLDANLYVGSPSQDVPNVPVAEPQGATAAVRVNFCGYGAAFLDFTP